MDRLDAMAVFIGALDEGSLAAASRRLGRSPAAVTRAIAALEAHVGAPLLQRTTRAMHLTEAGARYAPVCRRVLAELAEADLSAAGDRAAPTGMLTVTAPVMFGTRILRQIISGFLSAHPKVQMRYLLLDRTVSLADEGVDVALRIAHLPDSALIALRVGEVRRVVCAAPEYLARSAPILQPAHLAAHDCIAIAALEPSESWSFPPERDGAGPRIVRLKPRLTVNRVEPAIHAALDGEGLIRVLSYQVEREVRQGRLVVILPKDEPPPLPVHLVTPEARLTSAKVRAFLDFASIRLRRAFPTEPHAQRHGRAGLACTSPEKTPAD